MAYYQALLNDFLTRYWDLYKEPPIYQQVPTCAEVTRMEAVFDTLGATVSGYGAPDDRIQKSPAHKVELLMMHPEISLHNTAELAARRRVRKRKVSFRPRSELGKIC